MDVPLKVLSPSGSNGWAEMLLPTALACMLVALECALECRNEADLHRKRGVVRQMERALCPAPPERKKRQLHNQVGNNT